MLNISQFAKECKTTVKTIRHYDNIGLLPADYVSKDNNYRFYRKNSIKKYYQILALKQIGFTLNEIKEILSSFDLSKNLDCIEQKILLLKKQQTLCESIKKEYEKIMAETKKFKVTVENQQIRIMSEESREEILFNAKTDVLLECANIIEHSLNVEQLINIDFNDLKEILSDKTAFALGICYSSDCSIDKFDNIVISRDEEKATDLIVFFETSPDTKAEVISQAIESFLMAFASDVNVLFTANSENSEKGLTLNWISFK